MPASSSKQVAKAEDIGMKQSPGLERDKREVRIPSGEATLEDENL
jgi:hypothetical protein